MSPAQIHDALVCSPTFARRSLGVVTWCVCVIIGIMAFYNQRLATKDMALRQAKLEHDQQICNAIIDNDDSAAVVLDEHGHVMKWNAGMEQLTGVSSAEAIKDGLSQIICDPVKETNHNEGIAGAFKDPSAFNKLIQVHCSIKNVATGKDVPVCVSARLVELNGKAIALARIDAEENIVEFGTPSTTRMREQRESATKAAE